MESHTDEIDDAEKDILLKVWLFLFRPKHAKEKKQRLSSSFVLDDDDTLRGTTKPTHAKHGVEQEEEEIPKRNIMGNEMMRK